MKCDPAFSIIKFLGGAHHVAGILKCDVSRVYRWTYPEEQREGKGGFIPPKDAVKLLDHAKARDFDLRAEDFFDASRLHPLIAEQRAALAKAKKVGSQETVA